ncbi:MAG: hypothetical protein A2092_13665 [Rhodobacteraceae bacterium GWE1_64_9]|nr:MAG: hypothetical protein A2092_13665 [Rhodobacteraceae bacterium GWE1_64_9]
MMPQTRPPLVHICPLPPQRNGIADYAAAILERLAPHYELICVVAAPEAVDPFFHDIARVISFEEYHRIADRLAGERHLSHIGNNDDHVPILDVLSREPGVVVLHDLTLHYMMGRWAQQSLGDGRYLVDMVRLLHGGQAAELAEAKLLRGRPLQSIYSELNCLPFFRHTARAMITHSHYGHVLAQVAGVTAPVTVIPHFAEIPPADRHARTRRRWRQSFGVTDQTTVFVSLGFVIPNKQIATALQAMAELPAEMGDWRYVIGGENRDPAVLETCRKLGLEHRVIFLDYLDEADFDGVLAAGDVLVNLRYPTSGETSGTVCRALAHGLPCVVTDHGWYAELPETVTYRVPPGADVLDALKFVMRIALMDNLGRAAKSAAARAYAEQEMGLDRVVARYREVIEAAYAGPAPAALRPAPVLLLSQPPAPLPGQVAGRDLPQQVLAVLQAERASLAGLPARPQVLPGAYDLSALAAMPAETAGARQLFAALTVESMAVGGIIGLLRDALAQMETGDLLSLALVSTETDPAPAPGVPTSLAQRLDTGAGLARTTAALLAEAGFTLLRQAEHPLLPEADRDEFVRIIVATAYKSSDSAAFTLIIEADCS